MTRKLHLLLTSRILRKNILGNIKWSHRFHSVFHRQDGLYIQIFYIENQGNNSIFCCVCVYECIGSVCWDYLYVECVCVLNVWISVFVTVPAFVFMLVEGKKRHVFFCCCCFVLFSFCLNLILKDRLSVYWKIISAQLSGHNNFCDLFVSFLEAEIYNISTLTVHSHESWGLKLCFHVYIESSFSKQTIFYCLSTVPEWRNITIRAISQFP